MADRIDINIHELRALVLRLEQRTFLEQDWAIVSAVMANFLIKEEKRFAKLDLKIRNQKPKKNDEETQSDEEDTKSNDDANDSKVDDTKSGDRPTDPQQNGADEASASNVHGPSGAPTGNDDETKSPKNHGRNHPNVFTGANNYSYNFPLKTVGTCCEKCEQARYVSYPPKVQIRVVGQPILGAERHEAARAYCKLCGHVKTAAMPPDLYEGLGKSVIYSWSAVAMLLIMHYSAFIPFKRLESLQKSFGMPVADANQWDICRQALELLKPLFECMVKFAFANALTIRFDDTGAMIIAIKKVIKNDLIKAKENGTSEDDVRKGINASGFYIETLVGVIILFYTGRHHAAEIFESLLEHRQQNDGPKILKVTDAAIKNFTGIDLDKVEESVCHTHALLKFRDVKDQWPNEYALVAESYRNIYANDAYCRETKMTPEERLAYHQKLSRPWLDKINEFCKDIIARRAIDKKSSLWEPVVFIINQWPKLTKFLEIPGVPLDTNLIEQQLNLIVKYMSASFGYQTANGAACGDMAMSLISTAKKHVKDPWTYLTHCLQNHADLAKNPEKYLPWIYQEQTAAQFKNSA